MLLEKFFLPTIVTQGEIKVWIELWPWLLGYLKHDKNLLSNNLKF
jgi:hypothetical protein